MPKEIDIEFDGVPYYIDKYFFIIFFIDLSVY